MKRLVFFIIGLLFLTGCGHKDDLQGDVQSKQVKPGYTYVYQMSIPHTTCSGSGAYRSCTTYYTYIPIIYSVPTCYQITVVGKTSGSTCIDSAEWNTINIGDPYVGPDVDPKDRQAQVSH